MLEFFRKRKCFYCGGVDDLQMVQELDMYTRTRYHFHHSCLCVVLGAPEKNDKFVDTAIVISDIVKEEVNREMERLARRSVKVQENYKAICEPKN